MTGSRLLAATLLTAVVGALGNWVYELFFDPQRYSTGLPVARAVFVTIATFPFIFGGLVVLGIPASLLLRRLQIENMLTYALAGIVTGIAWGATVVALVVPLNNPAAAIVDAGFGCMSMLFWWWLRPRNLAVA